MPAHAWNTFAYHYNNGFDGYSLATQALWCDTAVPDDNHDIWAFGGRNYYFLEAIINGSSNNYIQVGVAEGKDFGWGFRDYFMGWYADGEGKYKKLGTASPANTAINLEVTYLGSGNWVGNVYSYGTKWPGQTVNYGSDRIWYGRAVVRSNECTGSTSHSNKVADKFKYALYKNSAGSWYYWPWSQGSESGISLDGCTYRSYVSGSLANNGTMEAYTYKW